MLLKLPELELRLRLITLIMFELKSNSVLQGLASTKDTKLQIIADAMMKMRKVCIFCLLLKFWLSNARN